MSCIVAVRVIKASSGGRLGVDPLCPNPKAWSPLKLSAVYFAGPRFSFTGGRTLATDEATILDKTLTPCIIFSM